MDAPSTSSRRQGSYSKNFCRVVTFPCILRSFPPERERYNPSICTFYISTWITLPGERLCSTPLYTGIYHPYAATETRHISPVLQNVPTTGRIMGVRSSGGGEREPTAETVRSAQGTSTVLPVCRTVYDRPQFPYAIWPQCGPEWG